MWFISDDHLQWRILGKTGVVRIGWHVLESVNVEVALCTKEYVIFCFLED